MAIDPKRVLRSLFERNPTADRAEIAKAFAELALRDPKLARALRDDIFNEVLQIANKIRNGKRLAAIERAIAAELVLKGFQRD